MATYDQLSAQQRAIVDLILKRGQSYDQLAETLGMSVSRVRELAQETLSDLAPVSADKVDAGWRSQIADYLLNQQAPTEAAATRGHLRRSESARAWSHSVLDSLSHLYGNGNMPTIPTGDNGQEPTGSPRRAVSTRDAAPLGGDIIRRRRLLGAGGAVALLLFIVLIWPVGLVTGGDDGDEGDDSPATGQRSAKDIKIVGQVVLKPVAGQNAESAGIAIVTRTNGKPELNIQAALNPTGQNEAYEVWLYNSDTDAKSLGAQVTDQQGRFAGRSALPANWRSYAKIDISREPVDQNRAHSGESVLQAAIADIRAPSGNAQQQ
jgi:Sigma-70, region 4